MAYGNYAPFYRPGYLNPMQTPIMPTMIENQNQFAQPYQAQMPQAQTSPAQMQNNFIQPTQANNDIIWVQGSEGAKAYLVAPNNTVTLWDSESPTIYVKSADINGVPSMRILDFTERVPNAQTTPQEHVCQCGGKYAPIDEFKALKQEFASLSQRVKDISAITIEKEKKVEVENDG